LKERRRIGKDHARYQRTYVFTGTLMADERFRSAAELTHQLPGETTVAPNRH
jgi:hypothetical protein